jgi:hypothetical protein
VLSEKRIGAGRSGNGKNESNKKITAAKNRRLEKKKISEKTEAETDNQGGSQALPRKMKISPSR